MGVEVSETSISGNPIATHTGQSILAGDPDVGPAVCLDVKSIRARVTPVLTLYHKVSIAKQRNKCLGKNLVRLPRVL